MVGPRKSICHTLSEVYNIDKLQQEVKNLAYEYGWCQNQISLQSPDEDFHEGTGRVAGLKFEESEYTSQNIPDDWEISRFISNHNLYRTRIMRLMPKACYSMHSDSSKRVHLPVKTYWKCKLIIDNNVYHLEANGSAYLVDTTKIHTAFNGTRDIERIHIVGCITT